MRRSLGRASVVTGANLSAMTDTQSPEHVLADLRASTRGTLIERMGIELLEVSAARAVAVMTVAGNTQPAGLLHGGASAALAETVGSFAAQVHAGPGRASVGTELNATHHRGAREGSVRAVAEAVHLGRTTASYAITITDESGRRVCSARLSCFLLDR